MLSILLNFSDRSERTGKDADPAVTTTAGFKIRLLTGINLDNRLQAARLRSLTARTRLA
jgi:hypothetical protein